MIFQPRRLTSTVLPALATLILLAGTAAAQTSAPASSPKDNPSAPSTDIPQRDTLTKMTRTVSIEFKDHRLEDVMRFIGEVTHADVECFWTDDKNSVGLDKDTPITLKFEKGSAMDLLEKVLDKAQTDTTGKGNTWQLTDSGTLQVGPKERLNSFKYVKVYPIADLLFETPNFTNAPDFDLQSVLQSHGGRGGGSGGQSIFKDHNEQKVDTRSLEDRVKDIQSILMSLIETDQWIENGGNGASIRYFQNALLVNAPDYIHRQIDGYPYWPAKAARPIILSGHRLASIDPIAPNSTQAGPSPASPAQPTVTLASRVPAPDTAATPILPHHVSGAE
jgi:hypothetical protein